MDSNDIRVTADYPVDRWGQLLPAEHLGEIWVSRGDVKNRAEANRLKIFVEENMAFLTAEQNINFTKFRKYQARLYLLDKYGKEKIQTFLDSIDWPETVDQLLAQVKP